MGSTLRSYEKEQHISYSDSRNNVRLQGALLSLEQMLVCETG